MSGSQESYPGDAIANKQNRVGQWVNTDFKGIQGNWVLATDSESHAISQLQTPQTPLTGESAGRQIWYQTASDADESSNEDSTVPSGKIECGRDPLQNPVVFNAHTNPNCSDILMRNQLIRDWKGPRPDVSLVTEVPTSAAEAAHKGMAYFQMLQSEDGHWSGDYGGPMFLLPGLICTLYLTKTPYPAGRKLGMMQYMRNHQQVDGGWGTHIECASTMFGTVLNYVALRLLGESKDAPHMCLARSFLHKHGGALYAPSWAKFWLAVLGVYDWRGINSIPAETWSLPYWFPFHPGEQIKLQLIEQIEILF